MDIRALRHFLALAETLHFGRAAALLHITQPPLSISIKGLEAEVGGALFLRDTRRTELTELGIALIDPARRAVQALEEVGAISQSMAVGETGTLSISFPSGATHRLLPRVLPAFTRRYPRVEVRLKEATSSETFDLIDAREIDLGIIYHPIASDRIYVPIPGEEDELVAIFPPGHPLAKRRKLKLADLANQSFVAFVQPKVPSLQAVVSMACQRAGFTPHVVHLAQRVETVISLVRSGAGVSLVPAVCARTYSHVIKMHRLVDADGALDVGLALVLPKHTVNPRAFNFLREMGVKAIPQRQSGAWP